MIARTASSVQGISLLILFPLTFLSNAFVPVDTLPAWLQWFVKINPVSHLVTAVRELTKRDRGPGPTSSRPDRRGRYRGGLRAAHRPGVHAQGVIPSSLEARLIEIWQAAVIGTASRSYSGNSAL